MGGYRKELNFFSISIITANITGTWKIPSYFFHVLLLIRQYVENFSIVYRQYKENFSLINNVRSCRATHLEFVLEACVQVGLGLGIIRTCGFWLEFLFCRSMIVLESERGRQRVLVFSLGENGVVREFYDSNHSLEATATSPGIMMVTGISTSSASVPSPVSGCASAFR